MSIFLGVSVNSASLIAQGNLAKSSQNLQTSIQRLSSGLRINSAADDPAGLAIANRMESQLIGLKQATRNASDGISLAQTANAGLMNMVNLLQSMRGIAIQASNGTNTSTDLQSLEAEMVSLKASLASTANSTQFNGKALLNGGGSTPIQLGANIGESMTISGINATTTAIGVNTFILGGGTSGTTAGAINNLGFSGNTWGTGELTAFNQFGETKGINLASVKNSADLANQINQQWGSNGVQARAFTDIQLSNLSSTGYTSIVVGTDSTNQALFSAQIEDINDLSSLATQISNNTSLGLTATADKNGNLFIQSATGATISFGIASAQTISAQAVTQGGVSIGGSPSTLTGTGTSLTGTSTSFVEGTVTIDSSVSFSLNNTGGAAIGSNASVGSNLISIDSLSVGSLIQGAVSRSKCNNVKFIGPVSFKVKSVFRKEEFCWALPA